MLQRLKEIHFEIKSFQNRTTQGTTRTRWTVSSLVDSSTSYSENDAGSDFKRVDSYVLTTIAKKGKEKTPVTQKWVVVKALIQETSVLPETLRDWLMEQRLISKGPANVTSVPDVAISAPISNQKDWGLFYNSLPLEDPKCGLPVSIHSRFAVSQDRRSLRTDGNGGDWNKLLAKQCLPKLYFIFLERLIPNLNNINFNLFCPESVGADNEISASLRRSFWEMLPSSSRKLVPHPIKTQVPISLAIFDIRKGTRRPDPVRLFVERGRPSHCVVDSSSALYRMLIPKSTPIEVRPTFNYLTPTLVLNMLREDSVSQILPSVNDDDLKTILSFALGEWPWSTKTLEGCYAFRLSDGTIPKIVQNPTSRKSAQVKTLFVVDRVGYDLFKTLCPSLVRPAFIEITDHLNLDSSTNIRNLDNDTIGLLVKGRIGKHGLKHFIPEEAKWVTAVYNYITSRNVWVDFYKTLPILPLSNKQNIFVAMDFWKEPSLLPPIGEDSVRRIVNQFDDILVRADVKLEAARKEAISSSADRFLDYLHNLVKGRWLELDHMFRSKGLTSDSHRQVQYFISH
jgi:hypothetical protein